MVKVKKELKDNEEDNPNQNFPIAHTPTRSEQFQQRMEQQKFGNYDDIKGMLKRVGDSMKNQVEHLPQGNPAL